MYTIFVPHFPSETQYRLVFWLDLSARVFVKSTTDREPSARAVFLGSCRIDRRPLRLARSRVARGLRAFPFASDSTGWLSAPRKSVSIAARTAPDPRARPGPVRVFRVPARDDFAERRAEGAGRRVSREARALDTDERVAAGRVDHDSIASSPIRSRRAPAIASPGAHLLERNTPHPAVRPRRAGSSLVAIARARRTLREPRR